MAHDSGEPLSSPVAQQSNVWPIIAKVFAFLTSTTMRMLSFASAPPQSPGKGKTFASQSKLPKLPIPSLEETCKRYLKSLEALQDEKEHEMTKEAVDDFLQNDGPKIQEKLLQWAKSKDRCVHWLPYHEQLD